MRALLLSFCFFFLLPAPAAFPAGAQAAAPFSVEASSGLPARPLTLRDCFRKALGASNEMAFREEVIRETRGSYLNALGSVLPQVSFQSTYARDAFTQVVAIPEYIAAPESTINRFTLRQTIFQGFREYSALSAGKTALSQHILEKERARQTLFGGVSDAFFRVLEARGTVDVLAQTRTVLEERLQELRQRVRVGRSRESETLSVLVALHQNAAQLQQARSLEANAAEQLKFLTGLEEIGPLSFDEDLPPPGDPGSFARNAGYRADVVAAWRASEAARQNVTIAKAGYWPSLTLNAYYNARQTGRNTGISWEALFLLDLPLLPQVQTVGSVRAASARYRAAYLQYSGARNSALLDQRTAYNDFSAAREREAAFRDALGAAEENFKRQLNDYRLSLVSNLDVLTAIQTLQGSRSDYLTARFETLRLYWRLRVATGDTP